MAPFTSRTLAAVAGMIVAVSAADAQIAGTGAVPYASLAADAPRPYQTDVDLLRSTLAAARGGDAAQARSLANQMTDPVARKLAQWATIDAAGEQLSFFELNQAGKDLAGWPRESRRRALTEKALDTANIGPSQTVAWFAGSEPQTPSGVMALASAYKTGGQTQQAQDLIRKVWRTKAFSADVQQAMLFRFGDLIGPEDTAQRVDLLLYGSQTQSARDLIPMLSPDLQAVANARLAMRADSADANALLAQVPPSMADAPGLSFERARYLQKHNLDVVALGLTTRFTPLSGDPDSSGKVWTARRVMINSALKSRNYPAAYGAAANTGMTSGADAAEAEFYAGWIALSKLKKPALADEHFAALQKIGSSPITVSRALYWRGRAAEARGDRQAAQTFYALGGNYVTTFYGQLAAEKAGITTISLPKDPAPTAADRARFEGRDLVHAARLLWQAGQTDLFKSFVITAAETLPTSEELALLVDFARLNGDQALSMKVVRTAAQRGFVLPERGYPLRMAPVAPEAPEAAVVFGLTRQESGFDPMVRSGVGARGMMQLMPGTASGVARRIGVDYSPSMLDDPDYNMRLGSAYFGHMVDQFSGSYLLAAAAYNAGPGRPADWISYCGDPRTASVDPVDFVECIPFSETRNYVQRVLEAMSVYRARLNGGTAPITLSKDLKRGGYGVVIPSLPATSVAEAAAPSAAAP